MSPILSLLLGIWAVAWSQPARAPADRPISPASQPGNSESVTPPKDRRVRPAALTPQQVLDHLALIKGNNTPEARRLGATRLLETGTPDAIQMLADVLTAKPADSAAQIAICEALADAEQPSTDLIAPLLALLGDKRLGMSEAVIRALSRFESQAVVNRLGPMAANDSLDIEKRLAALNALGAMSDYLMAVEAVVGLLDDPSPTVRAYALAAFRQATGSDFPDTSTAQDWWLSHGKYSESEWLQRRNDQKSADIRKFTTESSAMTARLVAAYREAFNRNPEADRPRKLLGLLSDSVPAIRQLGLDLVNGLITDRKDVGPELKSRLIDMLTDANGPVRLQATKIVGDLRLPSAFAKLSRSIAQEADPAVRIAQINAISRLDEVGVIDLLMECLEDDVPSVVGEAALALGRASRRPEWAKLGEGQNTISIAQALADHYGAIRPTQDELREQFLTAMSMIGDARFRSILRTEMTSQRPARVRRAAIVGLSAQGDIDAADAVRACLGDADVMIRLAAAEGLAKCGRRRGDLGALAEHLDPSGEPDAAVRQQAWDSYLAIATQLPSEEQIKVSDEFDRPTDKVAQRRRLEILKPLATDTRVAGNQAAKATPGKFEQLSKQRRLDVLERMADAQWNLGEFSAAASSLDQSATLLDENKGSRFIGLASRCVAARLKAHEDSAALQRIKEFLDSAKDEPATGPALAKYVFEEIRARSESATEAAMFADALGLLELARPLLRQIGAAYEEQLTAVKTDVAAKRTQAVDRLLDGLGTDPEAESKLTAYPKETLLARLHDHLKSSTTTSAPVNDLEDRWIQLARRIAPNWSGYSSSATQQDRAAALDKLLNGSNGAKPQKGASTLRTPSDNSNLKAQSNTSEP